MSRTPVLPLALICIFSVGACDAAPPPKSWPPGVVLAVDDVGIEASRVQAAVGPFQRIEPDATPARLLRLAFEHDVLREVVARQLAGEGVALARAEAERVAAAIAAGAPLPAGSPPSSEVTGGHNTLGFRTWDQVFDLEPGEWSGVIEELHGFRLVRLLERLPARLEAQQAFRIEILEFHFLPPETAYMNVEEALSTFRLTILDPEWREMVPERIQYAMHAH